MMNDSVSYLTDERSPTDWGWLKSGEGFVPVKTTLPPAPEKLLSVIRCNCQSDCSTLRCSCKRNTMEWSGLWTLQTIQLYELKADDLW